MWKLQVSTHDARTGPLMFNKDGKQLFKRKIALNFIPCSVLVHCSPINTLCSIYCIRCSFEIIEYYWHHAINYFTSPENITFGPWKTGAMLPGLVSHFNVWSRLDEFMNPECQQHIHDDSGSVTMSDVFCWSCKSN